jgi:hypothetical protein
MPVTQTLKTRLTIRPVPAFTSSADAAEDTSSPEVCRWWSETTNSSHDQHCPRLAWPFKGPAGKWHTVEVAESMGRPDSARQSRSPRTSGNGYGCRSCVADPVQLDGLLRKQYAASARHKIPTTSKSKIGAPVKGSTDTPDVCEAVWLWCAVG